MKNPKKWAGATSYDRMQPTDLSSSGRSEGNSTNSRGHAHPTRNSKATPFNYSKATSADQAIDPIPGATNTHPNLQVKTSEAGPAYGPGSKMIGAPKSGDKTMGADASERMPKKWHKRGYDMDAPSTEGSKRRRANGL